MGASDQPAPAGPRANWIGTTIRGLIGTVFLARFVEFQDPFLRERSGWDHRIVHVLFAGAVLMLLWGLVQAIPWLRLQRLSQQHPHEPWRWEFPQGPELVDEQLSSVSQNLVGVIFITPFLLFFHFGLVLAVLQDNVPAALPVIFGGVLLLIDVFIFRKGILPTFIQVLALMRYGQTRLRLPELPLRPGTQPQVELIMPRGRSKLQNVRAVLRRVRERKVSTGSGKNKSSDIVRNTEYTQPLRVEAEEQQSEDTLAFVVKVPPVEPKDSTDLSNSVRCLWEIQLTSDVPGLDLDVTFVVPVYAAAEARDHA
jgi:hypothetical protein